MVGKLRKYGLANIDYIHELVHRGLFFTVAHLFKDVANDGYAYLSIACGGTEIHILPVVFAGGDAYVTMYREANVSDGTALLITHHNDEKDRRSELLCTFKHTPTVGSSPGTIWTPERLVLGGVGPQASGGAKEAREEFYLKEDGEYLLAVQNKSGVAKDIEISLGFYPHEIAE